MTSTRESDQSYMVRELHEAATNKPLAGLIAITSRFGGQHVWKTVSPLGNSVLHLVAARGDYCVDAINHIANASPDLILSKNNNGDTPLHIAAQAGHLTIVKELLSILKSHPQSSDDDMIKITRAKNGLGNTPLQNALIGYRINVADCLAREDLDAIFSVNNEQKSGLYLASADVRFEGTINHMLTTCDREENKIYKMVQGKGKPPVHAAILGRCIGVLRILLEKERRFVESKDEEGMTPLHLAALTGFDEGVKHLVEMHIRASSVRDNHGFFPIHLAANQGHVHVVEILLKHSPDPVELLDSKCRNVLHIAAASGRLNVVTYLLKQRYCWALISAKDHEGNTPLHLATTKWHPRIVIELTWDKDPENLSLKNNQGLTAFDAIQSEIDKHGFTSFQQRLTRIALTAVGAPKSPPVYNQDLLKKSTENSKPITSVKNYKGKMNTLLVVATLIATITFAASFTVPGGYRSSDDRLQGQATLLRQKMFSLFILCNTISMYSAMIVTVSMLWAQVGDLKLVNIALSVGLTLLGVSLTMMSIAFTAGIYATVRDLHWLAHGVIALGTIFFVALSTLSLSLCFPISSRNWILRCISYYPFIMLLYVTNRGTSGDWEHLYIL